jgi:hypothetical protein
MLGWVRRVDWKLVSGVIGLFVSISAVVASASTLPFIRSHIGSITVQSVFVLAVVACAWLLSWLRQNERGFYAVLEIVFGILAGLYAANQFYGAPDPDTRVKGVFATVGGIYIIVRGLDNWSLRNKT